MTKNQLEYQAQKLRRRELDIQEQHNQAQQGYWYGDLAEKERHQKTTEQIDLTKAMEAQRHNQAVEGYESLLAGARADAAQAEARLKYEQTETQRHTTRYQETMADYLEAEKIVSMIESGSKSFKNITTGLKDIGSVIGGLVGGGGANPIGFTS